MGLAEPRRRLKISHDPNNLAWSQSSESYGQKLLSSQGWKPGQGLGARNAKHLDSSVIPKLAISYKDDTLGLGASLKSQDSVHTRTGLDAFQGLLGRLNGKSDVELKKDAQRNEDRKLAMLAQRRWGGVTFVPGGTLVQGDGYKKAEEEAQEDFEPQRATESQNDVADLKDEKRRKAEKRQWKDEKQRKREAGPVATAAVAACTIKSARVERAEKHGGSLGSGYGTEKTSSKEKRKKKRERPTPGADEESHAAANEKEEGDSIISTSSEGLSRTLAATRTKTAVPRTGRHVIRGRNIQAKKMAFSDTKTLDQIFMVKG